MTHLRPERQENKKANVVAGRRTKTFAFLVGQSCRSALNSRAARQRRPTEDVEIFVLRPTATTWNRMAEPVE